MKQYELSYLHAQLDYKGNHSCKFEEILSSSKGGLVQTKINVKIKQREITLKRKKQYELSHLHT